LVEVYVVAEATTYNDFRVATQTLKPADSQAFVVGAEAPTR